MLLYNITLIVRLKCVCIHIQLFFMCVLKITKILVCLER